MKRRKYKKGDLEKRLKALDKFEKQSKNVMNTRYFVMYDSGKPIILWHATGDVIEVGTLDTPYTTSKLILEFLGLSPDVEAISETEAKSLFPKLFM